MKKLNVGKVLVEHPDCGHSYFTKCNGKKEKEAKEAGGVVTGNCSVCWKLHHTPRSLKQRAEDLVNVYMGCPLDDYNPPKIYENYEVEKDFYTWLYLERGI